MKLAVYRSQTFLLDFEIDESTLFQKEIMGMVEIMSALTSFHDITVLRSLWEY